MIIVCFFFRFSIISELSSLNAFFSPDNGKTVMISTAANFLQGPILGLTCRYPKTPTGQKYTIIDCKHPKMQHIGFRQIRRNDEAPNSVFRCETCNFEKIE